MANMKLLMISFFNFLRKQNKPDFQYIFTKKTLTILSKYLIARGDNLSPDNGRENANVTVIVMAN
jgi:hypothetical protein